MICMECGTPLKRRNAVYCSQVCKQRAYRDRKTVTNQDALPHRYVNTTRKGQVKGSDKDSSPPVSVTFRNSAPVSVTFAAELMFALEEHARRGGTALGAAQVARRVMREHNVPGTRYLPLPRWNRAEIEDGLSQAASRKRR